VKDFFDEEGWARPPLFPFPAQAIKFFGVTFLQKGNGFGPDFVFALEVGL